MEISSEILNSVRGENANPTVVNLQPRKKSKFTLKTELRLHPGRSFIRTRRPRKKLNICEMIGVMFRCFRKSR